MNNECLDSLLVELSLDYDSKSVLPTYRLCTVSPKSLGPINWVACCRKKEMTVPYEYQLRYFKFARYIQHYYFYHRFCLKENTIEISLVHMNTKEVQFETSKIELTLNHLMNITMINIVSRFIHNGTYYLEYSM